MKTNMMPKVVSEPVCPDGVNDKVFKFICRLALDKNGNVRRTFPNSQLRWVKQEISEISLEQPLFEGQSENVGDYDIYKLAHYVWRNVVFHVSPVREHQCMPVCSIFDLGKRWDDKNLIAHLDSIVDAIENSIPKGEWYGIMRWGRAFGLF